MFSLLPHGSSQLILQRGWVHSGPSSPFPFVLNTGWNEFTVRKWLGLPSVPREWSPSAFFFLCEKGQVVCGVCVKPCGLNSRKQTVNAGIMILIIFPLSRPIDLRDFALIIAIINKCFMFPCVSFDFSIICFMKWKWTSPYIHGLTSGKLWTVQMQVEG